MSFRYTHAIVSRVPDSFKTQALGISGVIDLEAAKKQHEAYTEALRQVGLEVTVLPADESLPDCVFVEDTAVVNNGRVLITRPGAPTRRKEADIMRSVFKNKWGMSVMEIQDETATLEGGDVLFTGREFLVGLSSRTNEAGVKAVAAAFPDYPVTPIKVSTGLHLKSSMTMAGPDILCAGESEGAQEVLRRIKKEAKFQYLTLTVPDDDAGNCVFANGHLLHRADFPESLKIFESGIIKTARIPIDFTDLGKAQAHLTCASILFRKPDEKL